MKDIRRCSELLRHLGELDENLRVSTARVLIEIAMNPKGVTARHLAEATQLQQPAVNRAVLRLGSRPSSSHSVGENLGLITTVQDPEETRRHLYTLSEKGVAWMKQANLL